MKLLVTLMKNCFLPCLFSFLVLGLMSCHALLSQAHYQSIQRCKADCGQKYLSCKRECLNSCQICSPKATRSAAVNYRTYIDQQKVQGAMNNRELNSYRDPLKCLKVTCNCGMDANACIQACTGVVSKQYKVVMNCT